MNSCGRPDIDLFKKHDPTFARFRKTLDARAKELITEGVGITRKQADPVSPEDEEKLWSSGTISGNSGQGLLYMTFFLQLQIAGPAWNG